MNKPDRDELIKELKALYFGDKNLIKGMQAGITIRLSEVEDKFNRFDSGHETYVIWIEGARLMCHSTRITTDGYVSSTVYHYINYKDCEDVKAVAKAVIESMMNRFNLTEF